MSYIGGVGSVTYLRIEDSGFKSLNLLRKGGIKVWMFIGIEEGKRLNRKLHKYGLVKCQNDCGLYHRPRLFLTPKLLDQLEIKYDFVIQRPGDLIAINNIILHAVINNGVNFASAINYATKSDIKFKNPMDCDCRRDNRGILVVVGKYNCILCRCYNFKSKKALQEHNNKNHQAEEKRYPCPKNVDPDKDEGSIYEDEDSTDKDSTDEDSIDQDSTDGTLMDVDMDELQDERCYETFKSPYSAWDHYLRKHQNEKRRCPWCDKEVCNQNLPRHIRAYHP